MLEAGVYEPELGGDPMQRPLVALLLLVFCGMWSDAAYAERRVALVIGNSTYAKVGTLRNPLNDASDVGAALRRLNFDVTVEFDLGGDAFAGAIGEFGEAAVGADVALFYYAGHGLQFDGENFLLPVDVTAENEFALKRQAISLTDVVRQMEAAAKVNLVFLDACRDNPLVDALQKRFVATGRGAAVSRGLARVGNTSGNTMVVFATSPGKTAADGDGRNSPFSEALLQNVDAPGVEIEVLMKRVSKTVVELTNDAQEPERLSKLKVEFYFSPDAEGAVSTTIRPAPPDTLSTETAYWRGIENSGSRGDFESYLAKVAAKEFSGLFSELAEKRIASLGNGRSPAAPTADELSDEQKKLKVIAEQGPSRIFTKGYNGPTLVEGSFTRTDFDTWEEQNSENPDHILTFRTIEQTADRILLFDESRKLWLRVELKQKTTAWRLDGQKNWNSLYKILKVER